MRIRLCGHTGELGDSGLTHRWLALPARVIRGVVVSWVYTCTRCHEPGFAG